MTDIIKFSVKFDDMICKKCGEGLYVKNLYEKLREQYEANAGENGYITVLTAKCKCGAAHKMIFDCHEYGGQVTVCTSKIIQTGGKNAETV